MAQIVIPIKCDGDKCGKCRWRDFGVYLFQEHSETANFSCTLYRRNFERGSKTRLPQCLDAEVKELSLKELAEAQGLRSAEMFFSKKPYIAGHGNLVPVMTGGAEI